MRISAAFPSKYLKAADIPVGRDAHVQIDTVQLETMESDGLEKPVLYFIGKTKGFVLNRTNADAIATAYGDDTEQWHAKPIVLFATTTPFGGRTVPCLRVRIPTNRPATRPAPASVAAPVYENTADDVIDSGVDETPF